METPERYVVTPRDGESRKLWAMHLRRVRNILRMCEEKTGMELSAVSIHRTPDGELDRVDAMLTIEGWEWKGETQE